MRVTDVEYINQKFIALQQSIELQPHQEKFCGATQDLVFFGGKEHCLQLKNTPLIQRNLNVKSKAILSEAYLWNVQRSCVMSVAQ